MIEKRSFILGMFLSQIRESVGSETQLRQIIEQLCRSSGMTPPTQEEGLEIGEFLQFVGDIMERSYDNFISCSCRCHVYSEVEHIAPCCKFTGKLKPKRESCWE